MRRGSTWSLRSGTTAAGADAAEFDTRRAALVVPTQIAATYLCKSCDVSSNCSPWHQRRAIRSSSDDAASATVVGESRVACLMRGGRGADCSPSSRSACPPAHLAKADAPSPASHRTPGARSPGEELMTCNTSAVAVCCSSASRVSVNEPRILHRDDRLCREVLQQRDLLVEKRPHLLAVALDDIAEERHRLCAAGAKAACEDLRSRRRCARQRIVR